MIEFHLMVIFNDTLLLSECSLRHHFVKLASLVSQLRYSCRRILIRVSQQLLFLYQLICLLCILLLAQVIQNVLQIKSWLL